MSNKLSLSQSFVAGAKAAIASVVINSLLFFLFHSLHVLTDDVFVQPQQPLTIIPVVMASILPTFVGTLVFFLFEKFTQNGFKNFQILAVVFLVLSFASPFLGIPNLPLGFGLVLELMHIVVAGSLLFFLNKSKS